MSDPASKLIIDEDWKAKVQAEREKEKAAEHPVPPPPEKKNEHADDEHPLPPASFAGIVTMLFTQAASALGLYPVAGEEKPKVRRHVAKHFIDALAVLEEKTKGNLSADETEMLGQALHELRMLFVAVGKGK